MFKRLLFTLLLPALFITLACRCHAQAQKLDRVMQLSGVVVDKDSLVPIPYTAILVKRTGGGIVSDYTGFFSLVAQPNDTILFSAIGYQTNFFRVPDTLKVEKYFFQIHLMTRDTVHLKPFVFYSWPSKEQFKSAFLRLDIPNNDLDRARANMALAARKARFSNDARSPGVNYLQTVQQENDKLYYAGQLPPNNLFNPLAWAQFIQAWKDGSLNVQ